MTIQIIHNCETGEIVENPIPAKELAESVAQDAIRQETIASKAAAKQAVLNKLGLTVEELAALL